MLSPSYIILRIQRIEANSVDLDAVAHYEPPHQHLRCLQSQVFSSLVLKELRVDPLLEVLLCSGKQTGSHKSCLPLKISEIHGGVPNG